MAGIILAKPEIALASDYEGTRLILPRIAVARRRSYDQVLVGPADGDEFPMSFGGFGKGRTFDAKVRYSYQEHDEMAALVDLFEMAHASPDRRLVLRPNQFLVGGLDDVNWIVVAEVAESYVGGQAWDVAFTATTVVGSAQV